MKLPKHNPSSQAGFTLVEIMVGLVIGMLASIVIMQVFTVFEAQKRTTTGTADAQTNGGIALYNITRELQQAGYALMPINDPANPYSPLNCTAFNAYDGGGTTTDRLSPVSITDGVSDSITIRYGDSDSGGAPSLIAFVNVPQQLSLASGFGCRAGDKALIVQNTTCALSTINNVAALPTADGVAVSNAAITITLADDISAEPAAATNSYVACLGNWQQITYAVNNGNLDRTDAAGTTPSVAGIVNIQAQYGISNATNSNQIVAWVDATGAYATPIAVASRNLIKAVRIAVVARNAKREDTNVTTAVTSWAGGPAIDLSADADWQRYRYRVFETIIPLRSVVWAKNTL